MLRCVVVVCSVPGMDSSSLDAALAAYHRSGAGHHVIEGATSDQDGSAPPGTAWGVHNDGRASNGITATIGGTTLWLHTLRNVAGHPLALSVRHAGGAGMRQAATWHAPRVPQVAGGLRAALWYTYARTHGYTPAPTAPHMAATEVGAAATAAHPIGGSGWLRRAEWAAAPPPAYTYAAIADLLYSLYNPTNGGAPTGNGVARGNVVRAWANALGGYRADTAAERVLQAAYTTALCVPPCGPAAYAAAASTCVAVAEVLAGAPHHAWRDA